MDDWLAFRYARITQLGEVILNYQAGALCVPQLWIDEWHELMSYGIKF